MPGSDNQKQSIPPGIINTASGKSPTSWVQSASQKVIDTYYAWFGPAVPLPGIAPPDQPPARQMDYATGFNLTYPPRSYETTTFDQLRLIAENYNLMRLVIETRKDQVANMEPAWRCRRKSGETKAQAQKRSGGDSRIEDLRKFFRCPDGENDWQTWIRMIVEEVLVTDALTIRPDKTKGGKVTCLRLLDGATIHPLADPLGRIPKGDDEWAYQQVIKGIVAWNFEFDELIYRPRNRRIHKFYGFSPVEQVLLSANMALRRETMRLDFYTVGNMPFGIIPLPEDWSQEQIKTMQQWFDALLSGNTENRSKLIFTPTISGPAIFPKDQTQALNDEFDEWMTRIICYAFSVSPNSLVKAQTRSTSDTLQEDSRREGLQPILTWLSALMTSLAASQFGYDDLESYWEPERDQDGLKQAQIDQIYVGSGVMEANEVRDQMGLDPLAKPDPVPMPMMGPGGQVGAFGKPMPRGGPSGMPPKPGIPFNAASRTGQRASTAGKTWAY